MAPLCAILNRPGPTNVVLSLQVKVTNLNNSVATCAPPGAIFKLNVTLSADNVTQDSEDLVLSYTMVQEDTQKMFNPIMPGSSVIFLLTGPCFTN